MSLQILILVSFLFSRSEPTFGPPSIEEAEMRVNQFISFISDYCKNGYKEDDFQYILSQCDDPSILVDNDIPGVQRNLDELILYLRMLKKYNIQISYSQDFRVGSCRTSSGSRTGCFIGKQVICNGIINEYEEFIELTIMENTYKVNSVQSSLFPASVKEIICGEQKMPISNDPLFEAEEKLKSGNVEDAIVQYLEVRPYNKIKSKPLEEKLLAVNIDSIFQSRFKIANFKFEMGSFEESQSIYESILRCYNNIPRDFKNDITRKILLCEDQIVFSSAYQFASLFYKQEDYDSALREFNKCLKINPNDPVIIERIATCNINLTKGFTEKAERDIREAENLIRSDKKNNKELGFSILMKYVHSDKLNGLQYFLMAQIVNSPSIRTKQEFNLNTRRSCLLTRQFLLDAYSLGYRSESFEIYWNEYLNKKSRTCE